MTRNIDISEPIIKEGVRIFRPQEIELLISAIPKSDNQTKFEAMLYSGLRYVEGRRLYNNPQHFTGKTIKVVSKKTKATIKERWVKLNKDGQLAVRYFLRGSANLPSYTSWRDDLKLWCKYANIPTKGISVKSTRKTWESWLIISYPEKTFEICLSQGHDELTSLRHYVNLPFSTEEKEDIKTYTKGWGE